MADDEHGATAEHIMDLMLEVNADYGNRKITDNQYIARLAWLFGAEVQRREREADPAGWTTRMLAEIERLGLVEKSKAAQAELKARAK